MEQENDTIEVLDTLKLVVKETTKKELSISKKKWHELEAKLIQKQNAFNVQSASLMQEYIAGKIKIDEVGRKSTELKMEIDLLKILCEVLENNQDILL